MTITVEDGTIVSGANSYLSLADIRSFALERGVTLSAVDATLEVLVIKAMDYLESYRERYQGYKVNQSQALQFPRAGVYLDGYLVELDTIPQTLKNALAQAVMELNTSGTDLMPNGDGREVVKERVEGAVEVQYAVQGSSSVLPVYNKVIGWLDPLFKGGGLSLKSVRV